MVLSCSHFDLLCTNYFKYLHQELFFHERVNQWQVVDSYHPDVAESAVTAADVSVGSIGHIWPWSPIHYGYRLWPPSYEEINVRFRETY